MLTPGALRMRIEAWRKATGRDSISVPTELIEAERQLLTIIEQRTTQDGSATSSALEADYQTTLTTVRRLRESVRRGNP